jgi:hypothetical protein
MQTVKAFVAFLTLSTFMMNGIPTAQWIQDADAQGVSTAPNVSTAVPNYTPATMPQLSLATSGVANAIAACDAQALLANPNGLKATPTPSKNAKGKSAMAACLPTLSDTAQASDYKFTCDMKCAAPVSMANLNPKTFCTQPIDGSSGNYKSNGEQALKKDTAEVNKYLYYLGFQTDQCTGNDIKAVQAQVAVYQCKMQALASAEGLAANQLQMALNQNNQNFTKMTQFQNQVKDQMSQIDEILGPDPTDPNAKGSDNAQFGGLLGVQKSIQSNIAKWNSNKSTFKNRNDAILQRTTQNQQSLKAQEMGQVTDCLKGNNDMTGGNGGSLECYKPASTTTTDASGKSSSTPVLDSAGNQKLTLQPCGPLEYVRSQVTQAPLRGGLISASRNATAQQYGADFDAMVNSMLRDAGAFDTATSAGALVTRGTDWPSIMQKYSNQMARISAETGINVAAQLQQASTSCNSQGTSWYNQQINSSSSQYNLTLNGDPTKGTPGINGDKRVLNTDVQTANSEITSGLTSAYAVLGGGAPPTCSASDLSTQINTCYSQLDQRASDVLNGTGTTGVSTKAITGGSMTAGFSVACRGINNCVTTYQSVRAAKKTQFTVAAKAAEDFVTQGNSLIQNQLQMFASNLSGLQQQVSASFDAISSKLADLGMTSTAKQKHMEGEGLQTSGGKDGGPTGPYQNPKSMAAVLSGMVQPAGLMDFSDDGTKDLMADVQEQAKSKQEKLAKDIETYQTAQANISSIQSDCNSTAGGGGKNAVTLDTDAYQQCTDNLNACKSAPTQGPASSLMLALADYATADTMTQAKSTAFKNQLNSINVGNDCDANACLAFVTGDPKQMDATSDSGTPSNAPAEKADNKTPPQ